MKPNQSLIVCLACVMCLFSGAGTVLAQSSDTYEFEFTGGSTMNLQGSRALVSLFDGRTTRTADSGEHTTLPSIGFSINRWGRTLGSFMDFSFVDGGTASASVGSYASDVSSYAFDFHGGIQAQFPSGRVRPYVTAGGGFARLSSSIAFSANGVTTNTVESEWLSSLVYGGGIRIGLSETVGIRAGIEGVSVTPVTTDSSTPTTNYGRLVFGVFFSGKPARPVAVPSPSPSIGPATMPAETDTVRRTIAGIRGGAHGTIPPAQVTRKNRGGTTTLSVTNSTMYSLSVFLAGPQTEALHIAPGVTQDIAIEPGEYEIAARVTAPNVTPFYGTQVFARGNAYNESFHITSQ